MTKRVFVAVTAVLLVVFNGVGWDMPLNGENCLAAGALASDDSAMIRLKKRQTFGGYYKGRFSADGSRLALVDMDHVVIIDAGTYQILHRFDRAQSVFLAVVFSPDGSILAASYQDRSASPTTVKVTLWSLATGQEMLTFPEFDSDWRRMVDVSFSTDGRLLATNLGGVARLWDVSSGRKLRRFLAPSEPSGLEAERTLLSPDGRWLVVHFQRFVPPGVYDVVKAFSLETDREVALDTNVYRDWQFSPDSSWLGFCATIDKGKATERSVGEFWEAGSWRRVGVIEVPPTWLSAFAVDFSPNSEFAAIGGFKNFGIFSMATGELLVERTHPTGQFDSRLAYHLTDVEFSPNGKLLLTGGNDGNVRLWKIKR